MNRYLLLLVLLVSVPGFVGVAVGAEGLFGQYYHSSGEGPPLNPWQTLVLERVDATVDFNWATNAPGGPVRADDFAVRWTGFVKAPTTETYTFHTQTDDGVRLWVNDKVLIDNWTDHGNTHDSGDIALVAGQKYSIRLEYYENGGDARCQLSWSTPTRTRQAIPKQYLWVDRPAARNPEPADGAIIRTTWISLSWTPGDYAATHSIYVGTNRDEVQAGTGDTFRSNQTDTAYALGFPGFPYPDGLTAGTTYYWRIDTVQADGVTTQEGPVWSFSVAPRNAFGPNPVDGAEFVDPNVVLSWQPGFGAILHTVYFGDNYDDVNNASMGVPLGATTYTPGTLDREKTYYWRVDAFHGFETVRGEVWSFTTPGAVGSPKPTNDAVNVKHNQILKWVAGDSAASHEIYLGTDKKAVRNATKASPEYKGSKALGQESLDPGKLPWDTAYWWRVDEVNASGKVSKGPLWSFNTAGFLVVDDFEDYSDYPPDEIWNTWIDGFGTTTNGATVGYPAPDFTAGEHYVETVRVHGGLQSMPYLYDNNLKFSEATMTLVYPRNWTENGVDRLELWFLGSWGNAAERMYVALNGSAVVYNDDPAAARKEKWTQWIIPLKAFADLGVNLANVNTVSIGFGSKNNPAAGGSGTVYFDDIGVH